MRAHEISIEIDAPAAAVWRVLTDFRQYPRWNRTIPDAAGELTEGAKLSLWLELGAEGRSFDPRIVEVCPERLLVLEKVPLRPSLLRATHAFRLDPIDARRTRLTQEWRLSGLLAPVVWPKFRAGFPAFSRMNEDLALEAEGRSNAGRPQSPPAERRTTGYEFAASALIPAEPEIVYDIIADYREGHPRILPRPPFVSLEVEQGGWGAGTVFLARMRVLGQRSSFRSVVSEPEPGRILVETNDNGMATTFTVEPQDGGRHSLVTFTTEMSRGGLSGLLERWLVPRLMRPVYARELEQLAEVAKTWKA